jgi:hypothetical protein
MSNWRSVARLRGFRLSGNIGELLQEAHRVVQPPGRDSHSSTLLQGGNKNSERCSRMFCCLTTKFGDPPPYVSFREQPRG